MGWGEGGSGEKVTFSLQQPCSHIRFNSMGLDGMYRFFKVWLRSMSGSPIAIASPLVLSDYWKVGNFWCLSYAATHGSPRLATTRRKKHSFFISETEGEKEEGEKKEEEKEEEEGRKVRRRQSRRQRRRKKRRKRRRRYKKRRR
jgi:hypothetical protein